jgi:hypothetical protein
MTCGICVAFCKKHALFVKITLEMGVVLLLCLLRNKDALLS